MEHKADCPWQRADCEYKATHHYCPHPEHACTCPPEPTEVECLQAEMRVQAAAIKSLRAENEQLYRDRNALLAAGRRSLNWLASYPGGGALGCYDEMRAAVDPLEGVLTKDSS